ncbi:MAG: DUF721 domain-containing protein [Myxococcales bacterium]|nr:MAG: DUF721 domain-containing protein [Myxococcales bacterium]
MTQRGPGAPLAPVKPRSRPQRLGELLDGARVVSAQRARVSIDRDTWRRLLGDRIARRTEPGPLSAGVLTIYVASAPWAQELSLLTTELLQRLAPLGLRVSSVKFRVRQQIQASQALAKRRPAAPRAPLPRELKARLDSVEDTELRQVIAEAAELWLGREAKLSAKSSARAPRSAGARSDPSARSSTTRPAVSPSTPESPRGRRR